MSQLDINDILKTNNLRDEDIKELDTGRRNLLFFGEYNPRKQR